MSHQKERFIIAINAMERIRVIRDAGDVYILYRLKWHVIPKGMCPLIKLCVDGGIWTVDARNVQLSTHREIK